MRLNSFLHFGVTGLSWAVAAYALGLPLVRARAQRGDYLFGYHALHEIYVGIPALVIAVALSALWLVPAARRRAAMLRTGLVLGATLGAVAVFDLVFALGVRGAWRSHYWLDFAHVSRADNVPDPELGFRRRPNTEWSGFVPEVGREVSYRVDRHGFRNPAGVERADIAFVGDSYTEAAQVAEADTFVQRVGDRVGLSVVNLGRGAYGPQQERAIVDRRALKYQPRVVVWQLFDGNDLGDAEQFLAWKAGEVGAVPLSKRYFDNSLFRPLLDATRRSKRGNFAMLRLDDDSELPVTVRYRWMPTQTVERADGWGETAAALRGGIGHCRQHDVEVLVVLVPVMARVLRDRLSFRDPADAERYTPVDPSPMSDVATALAGFCEEQGVSFIDLYPQFRAAAEEQSEGLFIPRDEHLDIRGHEVVADAIAQWFDGRR